MEKKIKSINTKIFLIFLIIFYSTFLFYLAEKTSIEFDETTHSLLAVFYKDLIKYSISHLNFKEIYDYAYSYLVYYPKLSVYYPPLIHLTIAFVFSFFNPSFLLARCVIIIFSVLFVFLIFKFSKFILKNENTALLSAILFCSTPMTIYLSRSVYLDLPLAFFFTLTIFLYLIALERNKKKYYVLAGLTSGVCFLVKWLALFIFPIIFLYVYLEKREKMKNIILSFFISGLVIFPYVLLANKIGVFLLVFTSERGTLLPAANVIPQVNSIEGWLVYPNFVNAFYFVFPFSLLVLYSIGSYIKNEKKYWKLFTIWIVLTYIFLTFIQNKDPRFFFVSIFPLCLIVSKQIIDWKIEKHLKVLVVGFLLSLNFLSFFNFIYQEKSLYGKPAFSFHSYKTYGKEISDFLISNPYPTYFASETSRALPSETMFCLASQGKFIKILRPCAGDFDINKTLYEAGVKWVVYDREDKNNSYILELREKNLVTLERNIDEVEIYRYNFFNPNLKENCNIVCLIEEKVCEKVKLS
ncbi:MAG: glycosyltransferase family 39 protein [Candidatus Aenigmatarchaeota archaeon]